MDAVSVEFLDRLNALSWNEIRKEAKNYGISARGKKAELINKIIEVAAKTVDFNVKTNDNGDAEMDHKSEDAELHTSKDSNNIDLNGTYTVAKDSDTEEFMSDDESTQVETENIAPPNDEPNGSILSADLSTYDMSLSFSTSTNAGSVENKASEVILPDQLDVDVPTLENVSMEVTAKSDTSTISAKTSSQKSTKARNPDAVSGRFERLHAALFEKMPSITETDRRRRERMEEKNDRSLDRIKQLAKPKRVNECKIEVAHFNAPPDPKALSFKFGDVPVEDIAKVQRTPTRSDTVSAPLPRRSSLRLSFGDDKKADVKQLTKSASKIGRDRGASAKRCIILATTPVMSARLERLATPKGHAKLLLDDEQDSTPGTPKYTPHKGRYSYVDTRKMTNEEFAAYMAKTKN